MSLPLLSEVHVGPTSPTDGAQAAAGAQSTGAGNAAGTGVAATLIPSSVIQTVYNCGASDAALAVCSLDTATRTVYTSEPSDPTPVLGVIQSKNSTTTAIVVAYGPVTGFSNLATGTRYFLTNDGGLTAPPLSVNDAQYVHSVGVAVTDTTLFVMPQWPHIKRDGSG